MVGFNILILININFNINNNSVSWSKRVKKFEANFHACDNLLCKITHC